MCSVLAHATVVAVALDADGPLAGALLLGPSGCGKSALAISLIETCPWRRSALVSDDATLLESHGREVWARAPEPLDGLIEVRGFGPVHLRSVAATKIIAAFDLAAASPRVPEPQRRSFSDDLSLPLWPFDPAGPGAARLQAILKSILGGQTP